MTTDTTQDSSDATAQTLVVRQKLIRPPSTMQAAPEALQEVAPTRFASIDLDGLGRLDIGAAARAPRPVLDYVIPGMLSGSVAVMVGPGGVSKSMLALQTAAVVGTGLDHWSLWTDNEAVPTGRVAVFNVEDPPIILQTRIHDIAASSMIQPSERDFFISTFHDNVDIWPLAGRGFAFGRKQKNGRILPTDWIEWLEERVDGVRLAVFDTFIRGLDGLDENSSTEVAPVLAMLEAICRRKGVTFLILHHVNKASGAPGAAASQQAARGSSALTDNARWQTNLATMSDAEAQARGIAADERKRWVQVELSKCNYGPPLEGRWLNRGEGGVLYGAHQPPVTQQAPAKAQAKRVNGMKPYADPRRRPLTTPDEIDLQIPGGL